MSKIKLRSGLNMVNTNLAKLADRKTKSRTDFETIVQYRPSLFWF